MVIDKTEDKIWNVYKHTSPSGKCYIGITSRKPEDRWGKNGIRYKPQPFYRAIKKYGWDNIKHEVLYTGLTESEAKNKEKELIKKYKTKDSRYGYNCTYGGDGTLGLKRTKESIEKFISQISKSVYQYSSDGEFIRKWDSAKSVEDELGYYASQIGSCCLGRIKQAYGFIWRHEYVEKENPVKLGHETIKVYQYSLDGAFIKEWESIIQIEKELGFADTNISACCKGKQHTAYGYIWRFEKFDKVEPVNVRMYNQYDFEGNYIQTFYRIQDINEALGYKALQVLEVCEGKRQQAGGYMWSYEKKEKIEPYVKDSKKNLNGKKILKYSIDGTFIEEMNSLHEAGESVNAKSLSTISQCANGKLKSAYGFVWKYKEYI